MVDRAVGHTIDIVVVAKLIRQLIAMTENMESQMSLFDEAIKLKMNQHTSSYPKLEAHWIIARAWNNGVLSFRLDLARVDTGTPNNLSV